MLCRAQKSARCGFFRGRKAFPLRQHIFCTPRGRLHIPWLFHEGMPGRIRRPATTSICLASVWIIAKSIWPVCFFDPEYNPPETPGAYLWRVSRRCWETCLDRETTITFLQPRSRARHAVMTSTRVFPADTGATKRGEPSAAQMALSRQALASI